MPSDDVVVAFDILLEAVEDAIEDLHQAETQAIQKRNYKAARTLTAKREKITTVHEQITELQEKWSHLFSGVTVQTRKHPVSKHPASRKTTKRLRRGLRTPERD